MSEFIEFVLHLDRYLPELVNQYGAWIYALLFAIVFAETGLVITPFLPGDSLLFACGALAGIGVLNLPLTAVLLFIAAVVGDAVNYAIGRQIGPRVFTASDTDSPLHRLLNRKHLAQAHEFFERHGAKAIVLARFVPIVRTFVPFVAGAASMSRSTFVLFNITGGLLWVAICFGAGVLFGNIPIVKNNFSLVTIGIVAVSLLPIAIEVIRHRRATRSRPS